MSRKSVALFDRQGNSIHVGAVLGTSRFHHLRRFVALQPGTPLLFIVYLEQNLLYCLSIACHSLCETSLYCDTSPSLGRPPHLAQKRLTHRSPFSSSDPGR